MEERDDLSTLRINRRQIGALVPVTVGASESQIRRGIVTFVLRCDNVFDMKRQEGSSGLRQSTILAALPRAATNVSPRCGVHVLRGRLVEKTTGLGLEDRDKVVGREVAIVLGTFLFAEQAPIRFLCQFIDTSLSVRIGTKSQQRSSRVLSEAPGDRFDELFQ